MYLNILVIIAVVVIYEVAMALSRMATRRDYYARAVARARETGLPLMVVGNPDSGYGNKLLGAAYGYGDVTLDLKITGPCPNPDEGDIYETLPRYSDASHVIFVSYTLEYVPELERVIPHIMRVAGGSENVFVVHAQPHSLWSLLPWSSGMDDPLSQNVITEAPPTHGEIRFRRL
jgi:hypothetical protein